MKLSLISLGCDKNLVDSEYMLSLLAEKRYEFTEDPAEADAVIVNSCCFIGDAKEESIETILSVAKLKETGKLKALIVAGCLSERYREEVLKEFPEVDAIVGTNSWDAIVPVLEKALSGTRHAEIKPQSAFPAHMPSRVSMGRTGYAYLKIAEGCNKRCTYCIIPSIRGNYRSRPMESLLSEAKELAQQGVKELILVAQETCSYGSDLYGKKTLPELLDQLNELDGIRWIRLLYCYPEEITDEIIDAIKRNQKVCHYLDMPIQHASDSVLKRMGRLTNRKELVSRLQKIREELPDVALRTTLISGFPGETEDEWEETLSFLREMRFDRLGVFAFSEEEGTLAAEMPSQIAEELRSERRDALMEASEPIIYEKNEEQIGKTLDVIVEGFLPEEEVYVARTYRDAPDIDGYLFFPYEGELMSGSFQTVKVTASRGYDLMGEIVF